jgi:hypothetical protein
MQNCRLQQLYLAPYIASLPSACPCSAAAPLQGFFLALQSAWLVNDQRIYQAPGQHYQVDLQDGSSYKPNIHMLCKGPTNTGLSTFVMEGGGGSPGVQYAALVDELAAAGRRCVLCYCMQLSAVICACNASHPAGCCTINQPATFLLQHENNIAQQRFADSSVGVYADTALPLWAIDGNSAFGMLAGSMGAWAAGSCFTC